MALEGCRSRHTAPELHILLPACGRPPRKAQPSLWGPGPSCHPLGSLLGSRGTLKALAQPMGTSKGRGCPSPRHWRRPPSQHCRQDQGQGGTRSGCWARWVPWETRACQGLAVKLPVSLSLLLLRFDLRRQSGASGAARPVSLSFQAARELWKSQRLGSVGAHVCLACTPG